MISDILLTDHGFTSSSSSHLWDHMSCFATIFSCKKVARIYMIRLLLSNVCHASEFEMSSHPQQIPQHTTRVISPFSSLSCSHTQFLIQMSTLVLLLFLLLLLMPLLLLLMQLFLLCLPQRGSVVLGDVQTPQSACISHCLIVETQCALNIFIDCSIKVRHHTPYT